MNQETLNGEAGRLLPGAHGSATVELQFMVVPELLATLAYVPDPVRCKITDPEAIFLTGILGESGRKLVKAGIEFYFTRPLAEKLISKGIAVESPNDPSSATRRTTQTVNMPKDQTKTDDPRSLERIVSLPDPLENIKNRIETDPASVTPEEMEALLNQGDEYYWREVGFALLQRQANEKGQR